MIQHELSRWLGMFFFRNFLLMNFVFALMGLCFSLMYYRIYTVRNGIFRKKLLWYFGTGVIYFFICAFLWHPFFNEWMQLVAELPHVVASINLTHYILANGGYNNENNDV